MSSSEVSKCELVSGDGSDFQRANSPALPSVYVVKDGIMTAIEADAIGITLLGGGQVVLLPLSEWQRLATGTGGAR